MLNGKPLNRFPTGNWFSEHVTGYWIYRMSHGQDPGNADGGGLTVTSAHSVLGACRCIAALSNQLTVNADNNKP